MKMQKGRVKGFTIIETMLFLALTGLMLVGALVGLGTNLARQRYKDSVQDVVTMIRNQYDYVTRVRIDQRVGDEICNVVAGSGVASYFDNDENLNKGRGRSMCNIYGVAIFFGVDNENDPVGSIVQTTSILGMDIKTFEESQRVLYPQVDPLETIAAMSDQQLLKNLNLNNIIQRAQTCETVNMLESKHLNWGATIEDVQKDRIKKGVVLIIRSPRDGTVHTFTYDFSDKENIGVLDYSKVAAQNATCLAVTAGSIDINTLLGEEPSVFNNTEDFKICITSDDITGTYGKRRMIKISADGHNSSAVSLVDEASEDDSCQ